MKLDFVTIPQWLQRCYPKRIWHKSREENTLYLTFDDGPIPEVTPWVLDQLKHYNAKATFFCIGENIKKHPKIFQRILDEGHSVGNHTQHHINGWATNKKDYIQEVEACQREILALIGNSQIENLNESVTSKFKVLNANKLFRPPYGKITSKQARHLQQEGYEVVMWDVLSMDYAAHISKETCLKNVMDNIKAGSIVVFHDSLKAKKNLQYVLPKVLGYYLDKGL